MASMAFFRSAFALSATSRQVAASRTFTTTTIRNTARPRITQSPFTTSFKQARPRFNHSQANPEKPSSGLSGRFKDLSKKYGWTAVAVYLGLSALDFPLCLLAVHTIGAEHVAHYERIFLHKLKELTGYEKAPKTDVEEKNGKTSWWTEAVVAYGVHKLLIVFRVPATAAILPGLVKRLRAMGWNVGNMGAMVAKAKEVKKARDLRKALKD
ncbi:DUF1279 super [Saitoella coloradoensis]